MTSLNTKSVTLKLTSGQKALRVLIVPDCRSVNPYQDLLARSLEVQGTKVFFSQGYRRILPLFRETIQPSSEIDVLHLHWISPFIKGKSRFIRTLYAAKFLIDVMLVKRSGIRVVFPNLEQWVRRKLASLVDRIIVLNQATLKDLAQEFHFDQSKAVMIAHGHYRDVYPPAICQLEARKKLNLPTHGRLFLTLGLLRAYKGIETLLETWRENQSIFANCTLVIAGKASPAYAEKLQHMIAELPNVVLIPEFIEDDRIHLFFSAASIVVLPYKKILNSGSLILAMSYGVPVIAPGIGSISEYLGDANSLLFCPDEKQGLLKAMQQSLHTDLEQLSQNTIEACDRLDWNEIGRSTKQFYQCPVRRF
ncbi:glycosyltransferase family 4 protein [Leptolyngbya sp. AN03gr2]|uniref:glycosyltransferase family 4 protein n=1 Tax=Leptolyngbya sp. AN03gr2 TaxID=3423364 RepID=UPI003D3211C4